MRQGLIISRPVTAAIGPHLLVAFAAGTAMVKAAASATDAIIGASDSQGANDTGLCDVHQGGEIEVRAGGDIDAGDPITSDAQGRAIKAVPVAGQNIRVAGIAMNDASADDIFDFIYAPSVIATPA